MRCGSRPRDGSRHRPARSTGTRVPGAGRGWTWRSHPCEGCRPGRAAPTGGSSVPSGQVRPGYGRRAMAPATCGGGTRDARVRGRSRTPRRPVGARLRWFSVLPWPPTRSADGFGRGKPYPPPSGARRRDSPHSAVGPRLAHAIRRHPARAPRMRREDPAGRRKVKELGGSAQIESANLERLAGRHARRPCSRACRCHQPRRGGRQPRHARNPTLVLTACRHPDHPGRNPLPAGVARQPSPATGLSSIARTSRSGPPR